MLAAVLPLFGALLVLRQQIFVAAAIGQAATFGFALTMRRERLGVLVGAPTGGNQRGINGGAFFFVQLPRTGLEADLPLIGAFPPGTPPDAGVAPDIVASPAPADIAAGRDPVLAAALRHVWEG